MTPIFVAAAYAWSPQVRALHARLRDLGATPLSTWAESAGEAEDLDSYTLSELRKMRDANYDAIDASDVVIFLADSPAREAHYEVAYAVARGKVVLWIGRPTLSVAALEMPGVVRCVDERTALEFVKSWVARAERRTA